MARQLGHKITLECFLPIDRNDPKQQALQATWVAELPQRLHGIGLHGATIKTDIKTRETPDPELPLGGTSAEPAAEAA